MNGATGEVTTRRLAEEPRPSREGARRGYRLFAPVYDLVFGSSLHPGRRLAVQALEIRPGERVLELCVGSGYALPLYPKHARVVGVDLSPAMLARAAERVRAGGLAQVEGLLTMDAEHLAFADNTFDKAAVMFAVSGLPDPARAMRELARVCRPGATIVIANHFRSRRPLVRACEAALAPIYRMLQYRSDLELDRFIARAQLDVVAQRSANFLGYSTLLVCRNRGGS